MSGHFLMPVLRPSGEGLRLYTRDRGEPVATYLETAFDSSARNRGLLGRDTLADGHALVIAPCSMVHTIGMRFAIDLIFAARDGRILKLRSAVPPWRVSGTIRAFAVIEMRAGSIAVASLRPGQRLEVR